MFIKYYLKGDSIQLSGEKAGIPLSISALGYILKRRAYVGDGYYPPIIDQETYDKVQAERQERYEKLGCFTSNNSIPAFPVHDQFRLETESEKHWMEWPQEAKEAMIEPARKAAYIYTRVHSHGDGNRKMTASEQLVMIDWIKEHISQTGQE